MKLNGTHDNTEKIRRLKVLKTFWAWKFYSRMKHTSGPSVCQIYSTPIISISPSRSCVMGKRFMSVITPSSMRSTLSLAEHWQKGEPSERSYSVWSRDFMEHIRVLRLIQYIDISTEIPIVKTRRLWNCFIYIKGTPMLIRWHIIRLVKQAWFMALN